jgi:hypothetical protein
MVIGRDLQNLLHLLCLSAMLELSLSFSFFQLSPTPTLNEALTNEVIPAPPFSFSICPLGCCVPLTHTHAHTIRMGEGLMGD